jgi:glucose-1-phosphate thymidylyltransferase
VGDPTQYGVVSFDSNGNAETLEEKPSEPRSNYAVTGLYFYDGRASEFARALKPSHRGELEITDLNRMYLEAGALNVEIMGRGFAWLDTGTHASLLDAALFVRLIEDRQGLKICCPEEIAWRMGYIDTDRLVELAMPLRKSGYGEYLLRMVAEGATR